MRQRTDLTFQELLGRARAGQLNEGDVNLLNDRVAVELPSPESLNSVVVVQRNELRHTINRFQTERFARTRGTPLFIFPACHFRTRKDGKAPILHEDLFSCKDDDGKANGPGLLYYCKDMPAMLLSNMCTPLGIVNDARVIMKGLVPHHDSMCVISMSYKLTCVSYILLFGFDDLSFFSSTAMLTFTETNLFNGAFSRTSRSSLPRVS